MLKKDSIFVKLANCLQRPSSTTEDFDNLLEETPFTNQDDNELIQEIIENKDEIFASNEKRMQYSEDLRGQVFYNNLFNRTRRRFVFENTSKRRPFAVEFDLSQTEMDIYQRVTKLIREMSKDHSEIMTFALISRQRQMSSCLPSAFKDWLQKFKEQDFDISEEESMEASEFENEDDEESSNQKIYKDLKPFYLKIGKEFTDVRFEDLKNHDSKYNKFLQSIKTLLEQNPKEKIIVFSFFRGTNEYLEERLREDGINAVAIKGGMGDDKDRQLEKFRTNNSINVLISSEVGSEGLDLQFASVEYNYDLPWNPMRLEQRIGRIDRIGQKADVLRIYNLCCQNTIEDRILERLYERIKIFENSIGDMEDIVGQPIQDLALEILDPELTDEDRKEKAEQKIQVLINQRMMNNRLEEEAGVLTEYRDMVLNSIEIAKTNKRCIDSDERIFVIRDFLKNYFPGTSFYQDKDNSSNYIIELSSEGVFSFRDFRSTVHLTKLTSIDSRECVLSFAPNNSSKRRLNLEIADLDHPIFDWIKWIVSKNPIKSTGCSALTMSPSDELKEGAYVYYIQKWQKEDAERSSELKYFIISISDNRILDENLSEKIMNTAITKASTLVNTEIRIPDFEPYFNSAQELINHAWKKFEDFETNCKRRSKFLYNKQVEFVNFTAEKKIETIKNVIETLKFEGKKQSVINMNEKRIGKIERERKLKLDELSKNQLNEPTVQDLGIGVLIVE